MSTRQDATGVHASTPLTLVVGFDGAGKTTAIRHWLRTRPPGERWAVLANGLGADLVDAGDGAGVEIFAQTAGCACCVATVVLRPALHRVVRRGPFHRVLVELAGSGDAALTVDRLREAARGTPLAPDAVIAVVDAGRSGRWRDDGSALAQLARTQADCADLMLLTRLGGGLHDDGLRATLAAGLFGPRPVLEAAAAPPDWPKVCEAIRQAAAATSGARTAAPVAPVASRGLPAGGRRQIRTVAGITTLDWHWPASAGFEREAAEAWTRQATAYGAQPGSLGVFPTARAWYLWRLAADGPVWQPCGWRRDARVRCCFAQAPDAGHVHALEQALLAALRIDTA